MMPLVLLVTFGTLFMGLCIYVWLHISLLSLFSWKGSLWNILQVIACENQAVRWTTPLGLPVVQPYCKTERYQVSLHGYFLFFFLVFIERKRKQENWIRECITQPSILYYICVYIFPKFVSLSTLIRYIWLIHICWIWVIDWPCLWDSYIKEPLRVILVLCFV